MIRYLAAALAAVSTPLASAAAQDSAADPAAQALGNCLVAKASGEDRLMVARWMLASMASAPQIADVATVTREKKVTYDKAMAALFTRLLVRDCPAQSKVLFAKGNEGGFKVAGEALGKVAMQELLNNPKALAALSDYANYLNEKDFKAVLP